jgi:hypothetical protein
MSAIDKISDPAAAAEGASKVEMPVFMLVLLPDFCNVFRLITLN